MHDLAHTRRSGVHRARFPWTPVWANEGGRPEGIGDESGEGWPRGGRDGGGGANGRGASRAVECAGEGRDRASALKGEELDTVRRGKQGPGGRPERGRGVFPPGGGNGGKRPGNPAAAAGAHHRAGAAPRG